MVALLDHDDCGGILCDMLKGDVTGRRVVGISSQRNCRLGYLSILEFQIEDAKLPCRFRECRERIRI